jgi:hypothetical protein
MPLDFSGVTTASEWTGRWYRSLSALVLAAERALEAGQFDPYGSNLEMWWPGHDRTYVWLTDDATTDTRKYGFPVQACLTVAEDDPQRAQVRLFAVAQADEHSEHPRVTLTAWGDDAAKVNAAFDAARESLERPRSESGLERRRQPARTIKARKRVAKYRHKEPGPVHSTLDWIEDHPALTGALGTVVTALIAIVAIIAG